MLRNTFENLKRLLFLHKNTLMQKEANEYILGTDRAELQRLGLQHQVWSSEARRGWELAEFSAGQKILDLGSGPGFCTKDLAYLVGDYGQVIGIDKSKAYIDFLQATSDLHDLNIKAICADFDDMVLENESLDGAYCRWALAWIPNPEEIIEKVSNALVPGGAFVVQEYYDWSTLQTEPSQPNLSKCIAAALQSFKEQEGDVDVGRKIPEYFYNHGLEVMNIRPLSKMATPESLTWQWPKSFFHIYFPRLVEMGLLDKATCETGLQEMIELENIPEATILCPQMIEVIGVKM